MKRFAFPTVVALFLIMWAPTAPAETPDEVFSFAEHLQKDGLLEAAAQQFLRFSRENPTDGRTPHAMVNAASCLTRAGDPEKAASILETLTSTYPDHPDRCTHMLELGRAYYKLDRFEAADRAYTRVMVTMPECGKVPDAMLGKSEALISMGNFSAAAEVLRRIVADHIESAAAPRASYNLAFCLRKMGRGQDALRAYENVVAQFPADPLAGFSCLEAARMNAERGNPSRAIQFYARAKEFDTKTFFVPASMEGAQLLADTGDHVRALQWYQELLQRPDLDDRQTVHVRAVQTAFDAGDHDSVNRLADAYAEHYPKTFAPQIAYYHAMAAVANGDYDVAMDAANKLESFAPGTEWAHAAPRLRGQALLGMGRAGAAVDQFSQFVSASGDSAARVDVLRTVADVSFTVTRDTTAALDALTRMLDVERRRNPDDMLAVARSHETSRRYGEARRIYYDLITRHPLSDQAERADYRIRFLEEFAVTEPGETASRMDELAYKIATTRDGTGLYDLLEARIEVTKNFEGAMQLLSQLEKTSRDSPQYGRVLYLRGLCHAKLARRSLQSGDEKASKDHRKKALDAWADVDKKYANSNWSQRAAFDRVALRADLDGTLDVRETQSVLSRFPESERGGALAERLADQLAAAGGEENLARAVGYYNRAIQAEPSSRPLRLKRAIALSKQDKHSEALDIFERLSQGSDARTNVRASFEAGRSLRALERYREAIPYFEKVASRDPYGSIGSSAMLQAADCLYLQREYDRALDAYQQAERAAPTALRRWEVSYRIAMCRKQMGEYDRALVRMVDLLLADEGGSLRPRAYEQAAELAETVGDNEARITILEAWVDEAPNSEGADAAARKLVRLYLSSGQADEAYALADRLARSAKDDDVEPRALRAMALYRLGRTADAKKEADAVARAAGVDAPITNEIGIEAARYNYDKQDFAAAATAVRAYAEACSGGGVCEEARYVYAMSLLGANQLDLGTTVAQGFFRDYPLSKMSPLLHLRMGNVLATANRTGESLLHYEEAANTASDSTVAFMAMKNLGVSYQKLKRWREAERVWSRVTARWSSGEFAGEAALNVGRCKMEQGQYEGAIAAYEEALPLLDSEKKARAFYWMGTSYEQLGDYQSAVVEYLKVPYLSAGGGMWVVTAQLKAAECYAKIDRPDSAREIYSKVLRAHGANSNWGKLAQKGLDGLDGGSSSNSGGGGR